MSPPISTKRPPTQHAESSSGDESKLNRVPPIHPLCFVKEACDAAATSATGTNKTPTTMLEFDCSCVVELHGEVEGTTLWMRMSLNCCIDASASMTQTLQKAVNGSIKKRFQRMKGGQGLLHHEVKMNRLKRILERLQKGGSNRFRKQKNSG
jgi:hypothetical protein